MLRIGSSTPFRCLRSFRRPSPCVTLVLRCRLKLIEQSSQRQDWQYLSIHRWHERVAAPGIGISAVQAVGTRAKPVRLLVPLRRKINQRAPEIGRSRRCPRVPSAATPASAPLPPHTIPNVLLSVQNVLPHKRRRFLLIDTVMPFFCNPQPRINVDLHLLVCQSYHLTAFVARYIVSCCAFPKYTRHRTERRQCRGIR